MKIDIHNTPFLSKNDFKLLIMKVDSWFISPLFSRSINKEEYCNKLYTKASFVIVEDNDEIVGFTAFYKNTEIMQLYIPIIGVDNKCRKLGLGSRMLDRLQEYKTEGYRSIGLEVKKASEGAYKFYKKHGFKETEDRGEKLLMVKSL